jgi:hypothetical protein
MSGFAAIKDEDTPALLRNSPGAGKADDSRSRNCDSFHSGQYLFDQQKARGASREKNISVIERSGRVVRMIS